MKKSYLLGLILMIQTSLFAETAAIVKSVSGEANLIRQGKEHDIKIADGLLSGDILKTNEKSQIGILFHDGTALSMGPKSYISIDSYIFKPAQSKYDIQLDMKKGTASFESGKMAKIAPEAVKFKVPDGVIGVRGTKFYVEVKE